MEVDEEERNIFIDKREMRRAIINLLNNAVQHNDEDTTIEIRLTEYDRKIYLVIADDGKKFQKILVRVCMNHLLKEINREMIVVIVD